MQLFEIFFDLQFLKGTVVATNIPGNIVLLLIAIICLEGQKFVKELQQTVVPKYDCAKAKV